MSSNSKLILFVLLACALVLSTGVVKAPYFNDKVFAKSSDPDRTNPSKEATEENSTNVKDGKIAKQKAQPSCGIRMIYDIPPPSFYDIHANSLHEAFFNFKFADPQTGSPLASETSSSPPVLLKNDNLVKDDKGRIICADIKVTIKVELPRWVDMVDCCDQIKKEWTRFSKALVEHENGHIKIITDTYDNFGKRVKNKTEADLAVLVRATESQIQQKSDAFDLRTFHGVGSKKGEGANLDLDVDKLCPNLCNPSKGSVTFSLFDHRQSVECKGNIVTGQRECAHYTFNIDGAVSGKFRVDQDKIIPIGDWSFKCSSVQKGGVFFVSPLVIEFTLNADTADKDLIQFSYKLDDPDKGLISLHAQGKKTPTSPPCELRSTEFKGEIILKTGDPPARDTSLSGTFSNHKYDKDKDGNIISKGEKTTSKNFGDLDGYGEISRSVGSTWDFFSNRT